MFARQLSDLRYPRRLRVRRVPGGEVTGAAASEPLTRNGRQVVLVRLDESGEFALALSSESPNWRWPTESDDPFTVMLYRADGKRAARREVRRLLDPQRRDAMYKADLLAE